MGSDDNNLEEIQEKVDEHLSYNQPDFPISEIETQNEDADKKPWFQIEETHIAESFTLAFG